MALKNSNLQAFLLMLRKCEGTSGVNGYSTLFGGKLFTSFAKHPNVKVPYKNTYSTAAGAYQFLYSTWEGYKKLLNLPDFSPGSQDKAATQILIEKGALPLIIAGRVLEAADKVKKVWASLPGAGYNQPEKSTSDLVAYYKTAGGVVA